MTSTVMLSNKTEEVYMTTTEDKLFVFKTEADERMNKIEESIIMLFHKINDVMKTIEELNVN